MSRRTKKPTFTDEEWAVLEAEIIQDMRDEAMQALVRLERELYISGDNKSVILRQALDLLEESGIGSTEFKPAKLTLE